MKTSDNEQLEQPGDSRQIRAANLDVATDGGAFA